jgi:hypothetical protein
MNTRSDYYGSIHNSVFVQFQGRDQVSSVATYQGTVTHNVFWENVGGRGIVDAANNAFADPKLREIDRGQNGKLDPRPQPDSPVFEGFKPAPTDGYFISAPFKGAFKDALWALDWTALADNGHLKPAIHALVCDHPAEGSAVEPPTLAVSRSGGNVVISFASQPGVKYQVQSRTALGTGEWANEGATQDGSGQVLTYSEPIGSGVKFYRVIVP